QRWNSRLTTRPCARLVSVPMRALASSGTRDRSWVMECAPELLGELFGGDQPATDEVVVSLVRISEQCLVHVLVVFAEARHRTAKGQVETAGTPGVAGIPVGAHGRVAALLEPVAGGQVLVR